MRILFIKSIINSAYFSFDLGIASLSAVLKENHHEVDLFIVRNWDNLPLLQHHIQATAPDILAFSTYASGFQTTVRICSYLKKRFPKLIQIMGGVHLVLNPEDINKSPDIDAVCVGEGEQALIEFINSLSNKDKDWHYTKGFWTRKNNKIIKNPTVPFIKDVENLPFPDRTIFSDQAMLNGSFNGKQCLDFLFTRGCPFSCTYCSNHALRKIYGSVGYVRRMSPKRAFAWVSHDIARYRCECIVIHDDIFTLDQQWVNEFLNYYKNIKIPFVCNLRIGTFNKNLLRKLKNAGCISVFVGIESGDERFRAEVLNRHMTNDSIIQAFSWAKDLGLDRVAFLILGMPGETPNKWINTLKLVGLISPVQAFLGIFYPYPGTLMHERAAKMGFLRFKQPRGFVERVDSILTMPLFPRKDILYYYNNFDKMVILATPVNSIFIRFHRYIKFLLMSIPPSKKYFLPAQVIVHIDDNFLGLLKRNLFPR